MVRTVAYEPPRIVGPSRIAQRALEIAIMEVGAGEEGGNNRGKDVVRFREGSGVITKRYDGDGAWCAAFVSYCYMRASVDLDESLPFDPSWGAKSLWKRASKAGARISPSAALLPGDIVCWDRGARGSWQGHVGIVWKADELPIFWTIEGNVGAFPSKVDKFKHALEEGRYLGAARV